MKIPIHKRLSRNFRGKLRSRVLAGHGIGVVAATRNGTFVVDPGDFNVGRQLLECGEYDWSEVALLTSLVQSDSRVVFAGAHVGALLVPIVRAASPSAVIAYEPSPRNHRLLQMNLLLNEIRDVSVLNAAVGAAPGTIRFTENRINTGNSRVSQNIGEIEVALVTLDSTVPESWRGVDLLVMDVEGFEVNAMRGAARVLACTQRLYVEFAPEQLLEQGSSAEEFISIVTGYFRSAYIVGSKVQFLSPEELTIHLKDFAGRRGRLLNLLLTRDTVPDPVLIGASRN